MFICSSYMAHTHTRKKNVAVNDLILGLDVFDEIDDTVGVTVFIVVPRDEFHKGIGQLDSGLSIEY